MADPTLISLSDRFRGCLLGVAVGDAIGAPFEGLSGETIYRDFGPVHQVIARSTDVVTYTDDTQMALGVAECLLRNDCADEDQLIEQFRYNYETGRGYGAGIRQILDTMVAGKNGSRWFNRFFPEVRSEMARLCELLQ